MFDQGFGDKLPRDISRPAVWWVLPHFILSNIRNLSCDIKTRDQTELWCTFATVYFGKRFWLQINSHWTEERHFWEVQSQTNSWATYMFDIQAVSSDVMSNFHLMRRLLVKLESQVICCLFQVPLKCRVIRLRLTSHKIRHMLVINWNHHVLHPIIQFTIIFSIPYLCTMKLLCGVEQHVCTDTSTKTISS